MKSKRSAPKKRGPRADYGKPIDQKIAKAPPTLRPILVTLRELIEQTVSAYARSKG